MNVWEDDGGEAEKASAQWNIYALIMFDRILDDICERVYEMWRILLQTCNVINAPENYAIDLLYTFIIITLY